MILVAGGSGRLGSHVVRRLSSRGLPVRILTRDPARAAHLAGEGIEVVRGDVRNRTSVERAVEGTQTVISAVHGFAGPGGVSPRSVDRDGNLALIDAATAADAGVVLVSVVGASPDSSMELFRMKDAAERHLQASGAPWTIVRCTAFLEMWIELLRETAGRSGRPLVFGRGDNPITFVSVADVADVVERAATDASLRSTILEVGGEERITFNELAAQVQGAAAAGKGPRHIPRPMLRAMAVALAPFKPTVARQARSALALDTQDLSVDPAVLRGRFANLRSTRVADVLEAGYPRMVS